MVLARLSFASLTNNLRGLSRVPDPSNCATLSSSMLFFLSASVGLMRARGAMPHHGSTAFTTLHHRRTLSPLLVQMPTPPNLPPPTEEGGPLKDILPISLLVESQAADRSNDPGVGEDVGTFNLQSEKWGDVLGRDWLQFFVAVGSIMSALVVLWILPARAIVMTSSLASRPSVAATLTSSRSSSASSSLLSTQARIAAAICRAHRGRADVARHLLAWPSLCLAYSWITYYIAHCHDGIVFWDGEAVASAHAIAWMVNLSFFFLYPSVFNLKEVAAVERPKVHLWETGVIRITRHPQMVGQVMWSAAHLAMVGSTFNALTMSLLVGHHLFACWNGDRRLLAEHGDAFLTVKERTSIVPFKAIVEGRQVLEGLLQGAHPSAIRADRRGHHWCLLCPPVHAGGSGTRAQHWAG